MQPDSSELNSILFQLFALQDESHQLLLGLVFLKTPKTLNSLIIMLKFEKIHLCF